jgi:histidinol dehydrogenase
VRIERREWDGSQATLLAGELRAAAAPPSELARGVAEIITQVAERGDEALAELTARFDATERPPESLRVPAEEAEMALSGLDSELRAALELAAENVRAVAAAEADRGEAAVELPQGQRVRVVRRPVDAAGIYAPGGRAAYPSSVLMCCLPAAVAGVGRIVLCTPPDERGRVHPVVLAAAALAGVGEIYAVGGAQAIAALALGTETIAPVDVIAGPGNAWVAEAKRQLYGRVGIDAIAGPSELVVVAGPGCEPREAALDLLAQAEHGEESPLFAIAWERELLARLEAEVGELAPARPSVSDARLTLVLAPDRESALALADAIAPEHLELRFEGADAELAAQRVAGCVFFGAAAGTAFGDYAAGSNHVLPTGGAARFAGPLGPGAFMRRASVVEIPAEAARALAPTVDRIAREEGLPVHGESARAAAADRQGRG